VSEGLGDRGRSEASKTSVDLLHLNEGAGSVSGLAVCIFVPLGGDAYERQLTGEPSDQQVDADVDLPRDPATLRAPCRRSSQRAPASMARRTSSFVGVGPLLCGRADVPLDRHRPALFDRALLWEALRLRPRFPGTAGSLHWGSRRPVRDGQVSI
jgi:hypothetical protein